MQNLVSFVQFKKREKQPWSSVTFSKVQALIVQRIRQIWNIGENSKIRKKHLNQLQKVRYSQIYQQNLNQEAIQKAIGIAIENLRSSKTKSAIKRYNSNSNTL